MGISALQSTKLMDQLAAWSRGGGAGQTEVTNRLKAFKEVVASTQPAVAAAIDSILNGSDGSIESRLQVHRDSIAAGLQQTNFTDWAQVGVGLPSSNAVQVLELRKSRVGDTVFMEGKPGVDAEGFMTVTAGGKTYGVAQCGTDRIIKYPLTGRSIPMNWVAGHLECDNVVLRGKMSGDTTFVMEGFAWKPPGRADWETITPVRAAARSDSEYGPGYFRDNDIPADVKVVLATPDGPVYILDEQWAKELETLPRLPAVLPGEPTRAADGRLVWEGRPRDLSVFMRPMERPSDDGKTTGDTAWSKFSKGTVNIAPEFVAKAQAVWDASKGAGQYQCPCVWMLGSFGDLDASNKPGSFTATHVSANAENGPIKLRPAS